MVYRKKIAAYCLAREAIWELAPAHATIICGGGSMSTLREVLQDARTKRVAIGHFNFSELVVLKAATEAASGLGVPVVMGLPESEREFLAVRPAAALVHSMREEQEGKIFLNADHTHSIERAEEPARARFDRIVLDASEKRPQQSIAETRRALERSSLSTRKF